VRRATSDVRLGCDVCAAKAKQSKALTSSWSNSATTLTSTPGSLKSISACKAKCGLDCGARTRTRTPPWTAGGGMGAARGVHDLQRAESGQEVIQAPGVDKLLVPVAAEGGGCLRRRLRGCAGDCAHAAQRSRSGLKQGQLEVPDLIRRHLELVCEQGEEGGRVARAAAGGGLLSVFRDGGEDGREVRLGVDFEAVAADFSDGG
jgi:hypothetical protein